MSSGELEVIKQEFLPWLLESLKTEDIKDVEIEMKGMSEKGDNYMGDVIFMEAKGVDGNGKDKVIYLVMKKGKTSKIMREDWDARHFYLRENDIYTKIFPAFQQFQREKNFKEVFNAVPKCYGVLDKEESEAVLLENLKKNGYDLHDRYVNMNVDHIRFILYHYANFHAISFAMRDQKKDEFDRLTKGLKFLYKSALKADKVDVWYENQTKKAIKYVREKDPVVADNFERKIKQANGLMNMVLQIGDEQVEECVVTHGDCWNNNFMFQYKDLKKKCPSKVSIIDWQLSFLHSPVIDLSYFLYINSSTEEVAQFGGLLRYYHDHLCANIKEMGSDPNKLFSYSTLVRHWEKYSCYGLSFLTTTLEAMTSDKKDAVSIDEFENDEEALKAWSNVKPKNFELYKERIFACIRHYCQGIGNDTHL